MKILTIVGALALLSPCHAIGGDDVVDPDKVVATSLSAIRANPESFKGVWVSFSVQYANIGEIQNPFFTRFVATDFANFHVWGDEQTIWRREHYDDLFGLMFVKKDNRQLVQMMRLARYDRLRVTAVVRNTFQGMPWIELLEFTPVPGRVDTATLAHLFRGEEYMKQRKWVQAISELSLAPTETVTDVVKAAVHKNLGICHLRMGDPGQALPHFESAAALAGGGDLETRKLIAMTQTDPSQGLDREIDRQAIKDHERPLWEAFGDAANQAAPDVTASRPLAH